MSTMEVRIDSLIIEESEIKNKTKKEDGYKLILHNDSYNSFEHVFKSLIEVCKHDSLQAEQCTMIAHYNSQCVIKEGSKEDLDKVRFQLSQRQIITTIEQ